jgi:pilus assembly protein Flp/PilA
MKNMLLKYYAWGRIWRDENGQDLIEYALVVALIAFAAIAGMQGTATEISTAFSKIASKIGSSATFT